MNLTHRDFKKIRLRLGWTIAEMARRMGCHQELVIQWESNQQTPDVEMIQQYETIQFYLEEQSEFVRHQPVAESMLKGEHLQQVSLEDVLAWEEESESEEDTAEKQ
ncbi:MAG: helix-turn-helix transcriptional regulator [Bdellovibrionales bacterium]|nr:helix-turn-helix transcriptional regulator [Bdellovibrionales bacterium]